MPSFDGPILDKYLRYEILLSDSIKKYTAIVMSIIVKNLTPDKARKILQTLGKRETLNLLLHIYQQGGSYLTELERQLKGKLSRRIIHQRLKELESLGVLESTNALLHLNPKKIRVLKYYLSPEYSQLFESLTAR
jgi:DNA-binding HxlR family transcriptional regulator